MGIGAVIRASLSPVGDFFFLAMIGLASASVPYVIYYSAAISVRTVSILFWLIKDSFFYYKVVVIIMRLLHIVKQQ